MCWSIRGYFPCKALWISGLTKVNRSGRTKESCQFDAIHFIFYIICEISQNYIFTLNLKFLSKQTHDDDDDDDGLIETCSVWKSNNTYKLCQIEYAVLFM
jgi:hypothetical protein